MKNKRTGEQGINSYELFIGALSVLSILNLVLLVLPISSQVMQLILIVSRPFLERLHRSICFGAL
jgi:hypothetical protein